MAFMLCFGAALHAQTITDPRIVEFTPSPDHSALDSSGNPIVTSYSLMIYVAGATTPTQTVNLGKPAPDADGKIRVDFIALLSTPLAVNVTYEGRVSANGPGGSTPSSPSNDFSFTAGCAPIVSPTSQNPGSSGGSFTAGVTVASTCAWSASSTFSWITITAGATGMGGGTVTYSVAANTSTSSRVGTLTVAGVPVTVTQAALTCTYTISPTSKAFATGGESTSVTVTSPAGCAWSTTNTLPWITVTGGSGSGTGNVTLAASANTGTSGRSGTLTIAGKSFSATQAGITCTDTINPGSKAFAIAGESTDIAVTAPGACSWTAVSNSSWLSVTAGASGMGNGTVTVAATPNTGTSSRTGSVTIAGNTFNATQAGITCTDTINPGSKAFAIGGESTDVAVTAPNGCNWTAVSNSGWLSVTAGPSGSGNGTVTITAAPNTGTTGRTGSVTIAGNTFNATQAALTCNDTINPGSKAFAIAGESTSVAVSAPAGCNWSTTNNASSWITVTGGSGSGDGSVTLTAAPNTSTSSRSGTLTIAGQVFNATQAGITCTDTINPGSKAFAIAGESTTVTVTAPAGCNWTAVSNSGGWLSVTAGANGSGNGTVTIAATANTGTSPRTGSVTIAGNTFNATQAALNCNDTINPGSKAFATDGESTTVAVSAPAGCTWNTTNSPSWITVTGGSGSGDGSVTLSAAANTSPSSRSATLTIAGQIFNATQAGITCTDTIAPGSKDFAPNGESTTVAVTALAGCTWGATSSASWITITAGSNGSGNGSVTLKADANPGITPRSGTITIAGNTFNATQDGVPCTQTISPGAQTFSAAGGNTDVAVTAPIGCTWTAAANDSWLTITAGAAGSGGGTVTVKADAYTGTTSRSGSVTIAGNTFSVTQTGAACTYSLSPTSQAADANGDSGTVSVSTTAGCTWTATDNANWITLSGAVSGDGPGSVSFTVAANTSSTPRSGTISIGGKTFTVNQAGTACVVTIGSSSRTFTSLSSTGTVAVSAPGGCSWAATSSASWLKVMSGASGSGNGNVGYSVSANSSTTSRNATLTIGGNTFSVTQSGASCTVTISPTTRSVAASATSGTISVSAGGNCSWTATPSDSWLTVTSGASGKGNGSVAYTVAANNTPSVRSATIAVAGNTFKVTQAAGACSFTVTPNPVLIPASGGGGTISVTTSPGCSWTVSSPVAWLAIVGSGTSSGTATYYASGYQDNTIRKTTLTIAGQSIPVIQGAPPPPGAPTGFRIVGR